VMAPTLWKVGGSGLAFASAGITFLAAGAVVLPMLYRKRLGARPLLIGGVFYLAYVLVVIVALTHPGA
jgi:hypothetical protein